MMAYLTNIPREFNSDLTGKAFTHCTHCGKELIESASQYMVEKAIRRIGQTEFTNTLYEHAICMDCAKEIRQSFSSGSLKKLDQHLQEQENMQKRMQGIDLNTAPKLDDYINNCLYDNTPRMQLKEFQIVGQCMGNQLVFGLYPMLIGEYAMDNIMQLMSNPTTDFLDGFRKHLMDPSPDLAELFRKPVLA